MKLDQTPNDSHILLARCAKHSEPARHRAKWVKWGVVDNCSVPHTVSVTVGVSRQNVCVCVCVKIWLEVSNQFSTESVALHSERENQNLKNVFFHTFFSICILEMTITTCSVFLSIMTQINVKLRLNMIFCQCWNLFLCQCNGIS